jgi:hypothetical protein
VAFVTVKARSCVGTHGRPNRGKQPGAPDSGMTWERPDVTRDSHLNPAHVPSPPATPLSYRGRLGRPPNFGLLRAFGLDPGSAAARRALGLVRENIRWEHDGEPFFAGEAEPCVNGRTVALGAYFGVDVTAVVERLLGEQMVDGGWNCEQENGSTRGSFHTTIDVLEGLLEYEQAAGPPRT